MQSVYHLQYKILLLTLLFLPLFVVTKTNHETFIDLHNALHNIATCITQISIFDHNEESPLHTLGRNIKNGCAAITQEEVLQVLYYAQFLLKQNDDSDYLRHQLLFTVDNIIKAMKKGFLTIDMTKDVVIETENLFLSPEDNANTNEIVRRVVDGNILMKNSISPFQGNILKNGLPFINNFGVNNTFIGVQSGTFNPIGDSNTGFGVDTLNSLTDNGTLNVAIGALALTKNRDSRNTAIGTAALTSHITGGSNTAIGSSALNNHTNGETIIAIGKNALLRCTSTRGPLIAIGNSALEMATDPSNVKNIVIGSKALQKCTSGSQNVVIGTNALGTAELSSRNTAIGAQSGGTAGNDNVVIGFQAGSKTNGDNNLMIGNVGIASDSNIIRIGSDQTKTFIAGILGTTASGAPVYVTSDGQLGIQASSRRYKHTICSMNEADSASIYDLNPVTFIYYGDETKTKQYGLIAEEVDKVFPELVIRDENNEPFSVRYEVLPVLLLNEIQQLKQKRKNLPLLKTIVEKLQEKIDCFMSNN